MASYDRMIASVPVNQYWNMEIEITITKLNPNKWKKH